MLARLALSGAVLAALGTPALAAPAIGPILLLAKQCFQSDALVTQCLYQTVEGDRNKAVTKQSVKYKGDPKAPDRNIQFSATYQDGNDNRSWIEQKSSTGADQLAFHAQIGDNNSAYTYQEGHDQFSGTVQVGDGHWAATSSIGEDTTTFVYQQN
jgi:hypothetical protein